MPLSPLDQHRDLRHCDAADGLEDLLHGRAAAEQTPELLLRGDLRAKPHHLALQLAAREELAHLDTERLHLEGLGQVVGGAQLHGLDRGGDGAGAAEHDHRRRRLLPSELREQVEAAAARHHEVEQN